MTNNTNIVGTILVVLLMATAIVANEYEQVAEYRHHSMEAVGVHFDAVKQILDGAIPFEDHLSMHVNALNDYANIMGDLFVEGSAGGEALDRVWEENEQSNFQKVVDDFKTAMLNFKTAVDEDDSDSFSQAFREAGNACKGCHQRYRE